jgi:hypothetical protein
MMKKSDLSGFFPLNYSFYNVFLALITRPMEELSV